MSPLLRRRAVGARDRAVTCGEVGCRAPVRASAAFAGRVGGHVLSGHDLRVGRRAGRSGDQRRRDGVGQGRHVGIRLLEVERRSEVTGDAAPPVAEVRNVDAEAAFDQAQHRSVIEHFGAHEAAASKGRHDQARHAEPETDGPAHAVRRRRKRGSGDPFAGSFRRRPGRHDMVEEAAVLVVGDKQCGRCPDFRVGGQRPQCLCAHRFPVHGRTRRVLVHVRRREQPTHLRQCAERAIALEVTGKGREQALAVQRSRRILVGGEQAEDAVAEVQRTRPGELVHAPRHARRLELFGHRRPLQTACGCRVVDDRPAGLPVRIDRAAHAVQPIRVRRTEHGAVEVVADGEGIGERVIERQVFSGEVAHRGGTSVGPVVMTVGDGPLIHASPVEATVLRAPRVGHVVHACAGR